MTITRDAAGRVGTVTTAAGDTAYAYDAAGRVGSVTAPGGVGLAYAYDGDGLIVVRPISQEAVK